MASIYSLNQILDQIQRFLEQKSNGIISILGPTASGKTGFSVWLAHWIQKTIQQSAEIISVDSRQIFREINIASAKITTEEMQDIPHHGLDLIAPNQDYSVYDFQQYGFKTIADIQSRGKVAILCGGTMLWLDAITENYAFSEDPTAKSTQKNPPCFPSLKIGLHWDRSKLYDRINLRSKLMFEHGLIEETKQIFQQYQLKTLPLGHEELPKTEGIDFQKNTSLQTNLKPQKISHSALTSFGYQELIPYLHGEISYAEALANNQQRNRQYAKRQLTWWRGRDDVIWLDAEAFKNVAENDSPPQLQK